MKFARIFLAVAFVAALSILGHGTAQAQTADCSKREPAFPNQDSSEQLRVVATSIGPVPIRRGFYCNPLAGTTHTQGQEYLSGFGFGYDKARHRHKIPSLNSIINIMSSRNVRAVNSSDYNFIRTAQELRCTPALTNCEEVRKQQVIAATSGNNVPTYYPGAMPAGNPIGLLTAYCNYGNTSRIYCEDWVDKALKVRAK